MTKSKLDSIVRAMLSRTLRIVCCAAVMCAARVDATTLTFQGGNAVPFSGIPGVYANRVSAVLDGGVDQYDFEGNGFTPHISSAWRLVDPISGATLNDMWIGGAAFGDLPFVGQLGRLGTFGELDLTPDAGFSVVLNSLRLRSFTGPGSG